MTTLSASLRTLRLMGTTALIAIAPLAIVTGAHAQNLFRAAETSDANAEVVKGPWQDKSLSPEARAEALVKEMTQDEKLRLVMTHFSSDGTWMNERGFIPGLNWQRDPAGRHQSAGFAHGIPRLGIPNQWLTDAGMGVASQVGPNPRRATTVPSGFAVAASWNPKVSYDGGAMIGKEARLHGFNIHLAGSVNLQREPRNGRNFEYTGEDPFLAGTMAGQQIKGIQSNNIISTLKHFAYNDQETNRFTIDVIIDDAPGRASDLLALQFATEIGQPGAVMCAYNRVNGDYACESPYLLTEVLKEDWDYKGYVMSDWGATHSTIPAANAGLDQQSGFPFDMSNYFGLPLREAVENGHVPQARLDDMAERILYAMFSTGLYDNPVTEVQSDKIDFAAHAKVTQAAAEEGIVLLKNEGNLLPLAKNVKTVAVIGRHANVGVLSGGGSSQVYPEGGSAVPDEWGKGFPGPMVWYPSSPLEGLKARSSANFLWHDGIDVAAAAEVAAKADVVIVFGTQWTGESIDAEMALDSNGDALITTVAKANPKTIVVLQTGGPVAMPWVNEVGAIVAAWYPGSEGGTAIARVLTGEVNPSGHLPATFPVSVDQLPRPVLDGDPTSSSGRFKTDYNIEGAAVGYKWFDKKGLTPLFAFGHGLSYTTFDMSGLKAKPEGKTITATFTVKNTGKVAGKEVAQIYVSPVQGGWEAPKRLGGFAKVDLKPGRSQTVTVTVDPRLLATWNSGSKKWEIAAGNYDVILARSATEPAQKVTIRLDAQSVDVHGK